MNGGYSDALVVFGITGDLAFKKIIPALENLERRGRLQQVVDESSIFRIDHFLGKEAAENLICFRFANSSVEPLWNRTCLEHVQITMTEKFGAEGRERRVADPAADRSKVADSSRSPCP